MIVGTLFVTVAITVFVYYTTWVIVLVRLQPHNFLGRARSDLCPRTASLNRIPCPSQYQPFLASDHALQHFFLDRKWAMLLPAGALAGAVAVAGLFIASVLCAGKKKAPAAPAAEAAATKRKTAAATPRPASAKKTK